MVALQQSIVQASELQLAPEFEPGQRVEFHTADGEVLDASVVQINTTHWCVPAKHSINAPSCALGNQCGHVP